MRELLDSVPGGDLRVFVVWEPVLPMDYLGRPYRSAARAVAGPRLEQFWDRPRRLSKRLLAEARTKHLPETFETRVLWDWVACFPAGLVWGDSLLAPAYHGFPVIDSIDGVRAWLAKEGAGAQP